MKYAIVESGGKQYRAVEGESIEVDRLPVPAGEEVKLDKVLLLVDEENITVGTPTIKDMNVFARVAEHFKGPKVIHFKYSPKKRIRVKTGHRQNYTRLEVEQIGSVKVAKVEKPAEIEQPQPIETKAPVKEKAAKAPRAAKAEKAPTETKAAKAAKTPKASAAKKPTKPVATPRSSAAKKPTKPAATPKSPKAKKPMKPAATSKVSAAKKPAKTTKTTTASKTKKTGK